MKSLDIDAPLERKIRAYCAENDLNFNLLADMKKIWGIDMLDFAIENNDDTEDDIVVLAVSGYGNNIMIEQTEYTKKYLAN